MAKGIITEHCLIGSYQTISADVAWIQRKGRVSLGSLDCDYLNILYNLDTERS